MEKQFLYAKKVTEKVVNIFSMDTKVKEVINGVPHISLNEDWTLKSLAWNYYDRSLYVLSDRIIFKQPGYNTCLLEYQDFDELLEK